MFVWRGLLIFSLMVVFLEKKTLTALEDRKNIEQPWGKKNL
jgi:hypothetical protein